MVVDPLISVCAELSFGHDFSYAVWTLNLRMRGAVLEGAEVPEDNFP